MLHTGFTAFCKALSPRTTTRDILYLLTLLHSQDLEKTGLFSYNDLLVAFRAVPLVHPAGQVDPGFKWQPAAVARLADRSAQKVLGRFVSWSSRLELYVSILSVSSTRRENRCINHAHVCDLSQITTKHDKSRNHARMCIRHVICKASHKRSPFCLQEQFTEDD